MLSWKKDGLVIVPYTTQVRPLAPDLARLNHYHSAAYQWLCRYERTARAEADSKCHWPCQYGIGGGSHDKPEQIRGPCRGSDPSALRLAMTITGTAALSNGTAPDTRARARNRPLEHTMRTADRWDSRSDHIARAQEPPGFGAGGGLCDNAGPGPTGQWQRVVAVSVPRTARLPCRSHDDTS